MMHVTVGTTITVEFSLGEYDLEELLAILRKRLPSHYRPGWDPAIKSVLGSLVARWRSELPADETVTVAFWGYGYIDREELRTLKTPVCGFLAVSCTAEARKEEPRDGRVLLPA